MLLPEKTQLLKGVFMAAVNEHSDSCDSKHEIMIVSTSIEGTAVAQWLRCCATNRKVAGSIPNGVIGIFH